MFDLVKTVFVGTGKAVVGTFAVIGGFVTAYLFVVSPECLVDLEKAVHKESKRTTEKWKD